MILDLFTNSNEYLEFKKNCYKISILIDFYFI